jgi:sec-independent protein translocase protein TatC
MAELATKKPEDEAVNEGPPGDRRLSFSEHLDELRRHLLRAVILFIGLTALSFAFTDWIEAFVTGPFDAMRAVLAAEGKEIRDLQGIDPTETFFFYFRISTYAALLIGAPYAIYELWSFISVGLYEKERKAIMRLVPYSIGLFLVGVAFCYIYLFPLSLEFLARIGYGEFEVAWRADTYLGLFINLHLVLGAVFQLPLFQITLARFGILPAAKQAQHRRGFIMGAVVAAAILTPTGDPYTLSAVVIPMLVLFEVGLVFAKRAGIRPRST